MSDMIERIARAISSQGTGSEEFYRDFDDTARAVLEAMIEPTDAMILAASARPDNGDRETMYHSIWRAMISKAMEG